MKSIFQFLELLFLFWYPFFLAIFITIVALIPTKKTKKQETEDLKKQIKELLK